MSNPTPLASAAHEPIAIIGMGCWLPGANDPRQLWENVLSQRRQFRRMPDVRTPLRDYYDPEGKHPDKFYQTKVAVIDGFSFDWPSYRIPESSYVRTDACQWLALEVAHRALKDAGFSRETAPKDRTGVFIGNTCTGEGMRSNSLRLRWPVVKRALERTCDLHGLADGRANDFIATAERLYKSIFPELNEDFLAGAISATIAGRICNYFDFHGGAFVIDGACASSLVTVVTAANMLASNDLDMAVAGGVDISLDPFELVGFSRNGALSKTDIRPYDRRGDGFLPAEGAGAVVLKRLSDAKRDGDPVYALIRGWGMASDGKAGIMQPVAKQQAAAIVRAADRAGLHLKDLDFVEGHGTGTRAGDKTEIEGLSLALSADEPDLPNSVERKCGIGSLKSLIGHTKAAAGVASLIKAAAAVNRRVLPPTAACEEWNDAFDGVGRRLFPMRFGEVRNPDAIVRAGVSAFGFGGINTHLILESSDQPSSRLASKLEDRSLLASRQSSELFVFGGETWDVVVAQIDIVIAESMLLSEGDLVDLAFHLASYLPPAPKHRAAVIAAQPDELTSQLSTLREMLLREGHHSGDTPSRRSKGIYFGGKSSRTRVGFLFPGQGSQQLLMARTLLERFGWARQLAEDAQKALDEPLLDLINRPLDRARDKAEAEQWAAALAATEIAQPAICLASVLCARFLMSVGIHPSVVGGHSLGEISALHIAGAYDAQTLFSLATLRGRVMRSKPGQAGAMASLGCSKAEAEEIISRFAGEVVVANINSPRQTVISGDRLAIEASVEAAGARGIQSRPLPVSNAFHSPLVLDAAREFQESAPFLPSAANLCLPVISGIGGVAIKEGTDLRTHLAKQIGSPVDFIALAAEIRAHADVLIEVGPGRALSGLCRDIFGEDVCTPLASNATSWDPNAAIGVSFTEGVTIDWDSLYAERLVRPYVSPTNRIYLSNPAEHEMDLDGVPQATGPVVALGDQAAERFLARELGMPDHEISDYLNRRGSFLAGVARLDMASLSEVRSAPGGRATNGADGSLILVPLSIPSKELGGIVASGSVRSSKDAIANRLMELTSERTGYAASSIATESRLLDDLNLDSIKAGELVAEALKRFGATGAIDPTRYANASIEEIAAAISDVLPTATALEPPPPAPLEKIGCPAPVELLEMLLDMTSERTGYPRSSLSANAKLLDDLNLDSIKAGELVTEALRRVGVPGAIDATRFANSDIQTLAGAIAEAIPKNGPCRNASDAIMRTDRPGPSAHEILEILKDLTIERTGYPRSSLSNESRLLDDLSLDSIKAGEIVVQTLTRVGIPGAVDATRFANASLMEIAEAVADVQRRSVRSRHGESTPLPTRRAEAQEDFTFVSRIPTWTRNFVVRAVLEPRERVVAGAPDAPSDMIGTSALVLFDPEDPALAEALADEVRIRGGRAQKVTFEELPEGELKSGEDFTHIFGLLPRHPQHGTPEERLTGMLRRVVKVALASNSGRRNPHPVCVTYLQFSGGSFGTGPSACDPESACALAFARTLHLERKDLRVRVVDLDGGLPPKSMVALTLDEVTAPQPFVAAGFDEAARRYILKAFLSNPYHYEHRGNQWSDRDVILVTGGAKGIVVECVLGLARETGATFVLVGRSESISVNSNSGDAEIDRSLRRFHNEGLRAFYYSCDIVDKADFMTLIETVDSEIGQVTGVIHGASVLRPTKIENLTTEGLQDEVGPKVLGAWHITEVFAQRDLKLLVGFSSLVIDHGMPWSAGYSFANEAMERVFQQAACNNPKLPLLILSFGMWGDVGRPALLKSNEHLLTVGLHDGEISPDEGVRRFVEACTRDPKVQRLGIYGRPVGYPTWTMLRPADPPISNLRFIERIVYSEPEVEMVSRCRLTVERDRYLRDHVYNGMYIVPTVMALEALAQAGTALYTKKKSLSRLEAVQMPYPIVVDATVGMEIELRAELLEGWDTSERRVRVTITTEQTGFKTVAASATVVFGSRKKLVEKPPRITERAPIVPLDDLYGRHFFVGPAYQRMVDIYETGADNSISLGEIHASVTVVGSVFQQAETRTPDVLVLGDPYFRDTMLHTTLLHHLDHMAFTVRIDCVELFSDNGPSATERRLCSSRQTWAAGKDAEYELKALSENGEVYERWTGYCTKALAKSAKWPNLQELLDLGTSTNNDESEARRIIGAAAREFQVEAPSFGLACVDRLGDMERSDRHAHELSLFRRIVKNSEAWPGGEGNLDWKVDGKPHVTGTSALDVSFSHEGWYCLCTVAEFPQGCDIVAVRAKDVGYWPSLLGASREPLLSSLVGDDGPDVAGSRIWAALEAARKAAGIDQEKLKVEAKSGAYVLFRAEFPPDHVPATVFVMTMPIQFTRGRLVIVAVTVAKPDRPPSHEEIRDQSFRVIHDEHLGCNLIQHDFEVTWKEAVSPSRKVVPAACVEWFHKVREGMLPRPSALQWAAGVSTGSIGLVARSIRVEIYDEITAHDEMRARIWITRLTENGATWRVDHLKRSLDGAYRLAATVTADGGVAGGAGPEGSAALSSIAIRDYGGFVQKRVETGAYPSLPANSFILPVDLPKAAKGPRTDRVLYSEVVRPTLIDSDLVGNVSSITFFRWLAQARDGLLYSVAPELIRSSQHDRSDRGKIEAFPQVEEMVYLRQAFPFDSIKIEVSLAGVVSCGLRLRYDFYRLLEGSEQKVAVGSQGLLWMQATQSGLQAVELPESLRDLISSK